MLTGLYLKHIAIFLVGFLVAAVFAVSMNSVWMLIIQPLFSLLLSIKYRVQIHGQILHVIFMPAILLMLYFQIPPWVYALSFLLIFILSGGTLRERVPLFMTSKAVIDELANIIPPKSNFLDLGSANGGLLIELAKRRKDLNLSGIESSFLPFMISKIRLKFNPDSKHRINLIYGSFWSTNWKDYDCIYCYLSPQPMNKVWIKFMKDTSANSLLISNTFEIPKRMASRKILIEDAVGSSLYLYYNGVIVLKSPL